MIDDEGGPDHGLHEGQEHEPEGPRVGVEVVAEGPDEPKEPNTTSPTLARVATARTRLAQRRVVHRAPFPSSTGDTMPALALEATGPNVTGLREGQSVARLGTGLVPERGLTRGHSPTRSRTMGRFSVQTF